MLDSRQRNQGEELKGNQSKLMSDSRPLYLNLERGEAGVLLEQPQPTIGPIQHMVAIPTERVAT
jgi:hypothetical protein